MNCTEELSRFIVNARAEDFPAEVCEAAKKSLLDWIGVTLGAMNEQGTLILLELVKEMMKGGEQSTVLGHGFKTTTLNAALLNGMMAHALDYDDAHSGVRTHPSAPMIPALLSIGEFLGASGPDLIAAIVAGFDVTIRLGYALGREWYEKGWHATSVLGRIGAAAAASRLLKINSGETSVALGLAATQAGGLRDVFGTMSKPFHAGKAAMDGLLSALLAQRGFSGPSDIFGQEGGFGRVFTEKYELEAILRRLGVDYLILENNFKPYAACLLTHPVIDGLITLRTKHRLEPESIKEVNIRVAPWALKVAGNLAPRDGTEAKFSVAVAAALALIHGRAVDGVFSDANVRDPRIKALVDKISMTPVAELEETEAMLQVVLHDGRPFAIHVVTPKGDPRNPLSFDEVAEKMRDLARKALPARTVEKIIETVRGLEKLGNAAQLVRLCTRH